MSQEGANKKSLGLRSVKFGSFSFPPRAAAPRKRRHWSSHYPRYFISGRVGEQNEKLCQFSIVVVLIFLSAMQLCNAQVYQIVRCLKTRRIKVTLSKFVPAVNEMVGHPALFFPPPLAEVSIKL